MHNHQIAYALLFAQTISLNYLKLHLQCKIQVPKIAIFANPVLEVLQRMRV